MKTIISRALKVILVLTTCIVATHAASLFKRWKMTLTGEVLNVLNRHNVRYAGFDLFTFNGRVVGQLDRVLPIVPSAGVVVEF